MRSLIIEREDNRRMTKQIKGERNEGRDDGRKEGQKERKEGKEGRKLRRMDAKGRIKSRKSKNN